MAELKLGQQKFLQLLRSTVKETKAEAIDALKLLKTKMNASHADGSMAVARYYTKEGNTGPVKSVLGVYSRIGEGEVECTVYDADDAQIQTIEAALNKLDGGEEVDGSVAHSIKNAIDALDLGVVGGDNKYVTTVSQTDGKVSATSRALVDSNDKFLSLTEGGITAKVSLKKLESAASLGANVKEAYQLVDKNGEKLADSDYVLVYKDQTLKSAEIKKAIPSGEGGKPEQDCLVLTYIGADGKDVVVNIALGDFLRESEFKNGLNVVGGEVSVKLGETAEKNKNFIVMEGAEGKKSLAVRGMDTNKTVTTERIPVAGGPLAKLVKDAGITEFKQGDNVQDILMSLLCKELLPIAPKRNPASIKSAHQEPTVSLDKSGTVEVGTIATFGKVTVKEPTVTPKSQTYSGFEYGYATELNGGVTAGNPGENVVHNPHIEKQSYTLTVSGEVSYTSTGNAATINADSSKNKTYTFAVSEGENKVTASITGSNSTGTVAASGKYYVSSNLSKIYETTPEKLKPGVATVAADDGYTVTAATSSASVSKTVTGRYKYFMGDLDGDNAAAGKLTSSQVRALTTKSDWVTSGNQTVVGSGAIKSNGGSIILAVPQGKKLLTVQNGLGANIMGNFSVKETVTVNCAGSATKVYNLFIYPITNGEQVEFKNMTFGDAK